MEKDILDVIAEHFIDERLGEILMQEGAYVELQNKIWEQAENFEKMDIDRGKRLAVEKLISLYIKSIEFYAKESYVSGFRDCISLLQKVGLIKSS